MSCFTMAGDSNDNLGVTDGYEIPPRVSLQRCVQGNDWFPVSESGSPSATDRLQMHTNQLEPAQRPYSSTTSFHLPISAKTLLFTARGQLGGVFRVVSSPDQGPGSAKVEVVVRYDNLELRDVIRACLLNRQVDEYGVGLFVNKNLLLHSIIFEMTVILPETSSSLVSIQNFETDLPNTVHLFGDLSGKVSFNSVSLRGLNGKVDVQSLTAGRAQVHTFNSEIRGSFDVTDELNLNTGNAPIHVDVAMKSVEEKADPKFRALTMNGILEANVKLLSSSGSGGYFDIKAQTMNAPLRLNFPISPPNSSLNLEAMTCNANATVSLDPAYEGSFLLDTSCFHFKPTVEQTVRGLEDPAGWQRKRRVGYELSGWPGNLATGTIYWDDEATKVGTMDRRATSRGYGQVNVRSMNAGVILQV